MHKIKKVKAPNVLKWKTGQVREKNKNSFQSVDKLRATEQKEAFCTNILICVL